jgi:protein-S-isoprenylcysteine O-methyltransferase Ste14
MPAKLLGVTVIICAFVIFALALGALGNSWRLGTDQKEERFLASAHGASYEAYRARTARYIAWPKPARSRR